jgi:hypothetical protein
MSRSTLPSTISVSLMLYCGMCVPGVLFVHGWEAANNNTSPGIVAALKRMPRSTCAYRAQTHAQYATVSRDDNLRDVVAAYDVLAKAMVSLRRWRWWA